MFRVEHKAPRIGEGARLDEGSQPPGSPAQSGQTWGAAEHTPTPPYDIFQMVREAVSTPAAKMVMVCQVGVPK